MEEPRYTGRLAPSPTGALHIGNVRTFMIAYLRARSQNGRLIMRIEDLDHPHVKQGAAREMLDDLRFLGFEWDEEYVQSRRIEHYKEALERIRDRVYPCVCSRRDVEAAQSAPHAGEQLYYDGRCRGRFASWEEAAQSIAPRTPCWRFRVEQGASVSFTDSFAGAFTMDVSRTLGDFPISRHPEGAGYTLAVVVDDAEMGVTEVVRGDDLLAATPAQMLLQDALGFAHPKYCHVPLVVGNDGRRLAKRHGDTRISTLRSQGWSAGKIIGYLAASCGWAEQGEELALSSLVERFSLDTIPRAPFVIGVGAH